MHVDPYYVWLALALLVIFTICIVLDHRASRRLVRSADARTRASERAWAEAVTDEKAKTTAAERRIGQIWTEVDALTAAVHRVVGSIIGSDPDQGREPMTIDAALAALAMGESHVVHTNERVDRLVEADREHVTEKQSLAMAVTFAVAYLDRYDEWATDAARRLPNGGMTPTLRRHLKALDVEVGEWQQGIEQHGLLTSVWEEEDDPEVVVDVHLPDDEPDATTTAELDGALHRGQVYDQLRAQGMTPLDAATGEPLSREQYQFASSPIRVFGKAGHVPAVPLGEDLSELSTAELERRFTEATGIAPPPSKV